MSQNLNNWESESCQRELRILRRFVHWSLEHVGEILQPAIDCYGGLFRQARNLPRCKDA